MIAIGMMVFTATANTAKLEQKQKTEFVTEAPSQAYDVCVNNYQATFELSEVANTNDSIVMDLSNVTFFAPSLIYINDVSWQYYSKGNHLHFKESILSRNELYGLSTYSVMTIQKYFLSSISIRSYC
jgi:hypothetical protein